MDGMNERKGGFVVSQSFFYGNIIDVQGIKVSVFTIVFTTPLGAAVDLWQLPRCGHLLYLCVVRHTSGVLFFALGVIVLLAAGVARPRVDLIHVS